jgi:DNA-binding transcriptional regulator YiaG
MTINHPEERSRRMRELIAQSGLTHAEIARRLEVSKRTVDCWAAVGAGHRNPPAIALKLMETIAK